MTIKHFFEVYPPKRMWRKLWIGLSSLPMLPQHRATILKLGGGKYQRTFYDIWRCWDRYCLS